jgi:hypothetical protein
MAEKTYTLKEITMAWAKYKSMSVIRLLKAGKWEYILLEGKGIPRFEATRAERVHPSDYMAFPKFLEEIWQKKGKSQS